MDPAFIQPHRPRFGCLLRGCAGAWLALALGAGNAAAQSDGAARASEAPASGTFTFQNKTGQTVNRLTVVFGSEIRSIDYASFASTTSGSTVQVGTFFLAPGQLVKVAATVDGKNIRILTWQWADPVDTPIGAMNRGCSARNGCSEIKQEGTALDLATPTITIQPLQEITYCYYFKTGNAGIVALKRIHATLSPYVVRMNLVFTPQEAQPPGTVSSANCRPLFSEGVGGFGRWVFTAYDSGDEVAFPSDDGTGRPVGLFVAPDQHAYLSMVVLNPTDQPVTVQAEIHADQYRSGTPVTPASPLLVYNGQISLPPGTADIEVQSCPMPLGATFFWMSTYAHRRMVGSYVLDGIDTIFQATDFANPGAREWTVPPFFSFTSDVMTYRFDYLNPLIITVVDGPSYGVDEVGAVLSYYFPGSSPRSCFDGNFF